MKPSSEIKALVKHVDHAIGSEYAKVIGTAKRNHHYKGESVENPLGNWIADVMRWKTGADIGFQNTGGIRADILAGPVTKGNIFEVSPFRNSLVLFELTGKQIKSLLEHDVEKGWDRLQISGMKYAYYPKNTRPFGQRVQLVSVNGEILVKRGKVLFPDKLFSVVSNNYLVGQAKDKYFGFPVRHSQDLGILINQALISWLEKHEFLDYVIENRIVEIHK
jgi:2',3'-cyclic-nucleotide 2'-phosphodiesterase (5'-nucleotidase family)